MKVAGRTICGSNRCSSTAAGRVFGLSVERLSSQQRCREKKIKAVQSVTTGV